MRLIDVRKLEVKEFLNEDHVPPYAILSHTWGADECTLQAMKDADIGARAGYPKIKRCCEQAKEDGLDWAWVDTCCIDKTSTTELSEAINSMFRWYRMAKVCYAYLSDVVKIEDMPHSRWFMRGWTLQELIAPRNIVFYCESWIELGTKETLQKDISYITDIEQSVLLSGLIDKVSIARRMSWASKRETTRLEDRAYSLLRIFDVNMPLLYGEGKRAFTRLQEEIMKHSEDHSLFAWGLSTDICSATDLIQSPHFPAASNLRPLTGLFADDPSSFTNTSAIETLDGLQSDMSPIVRFGVRIELPVIDVGPIQVAVISCSIRKFSQNCFLGLLVIPWSGKCHGRYGSPVLIEQKEWSRSRSMIKSKMKSLLIRAAPNSLEISDRSLIELDYSLHILSQPDANILDMFRLQVYSLPHAEIDPEDHGGRIILSKVRDGPHAAVFLWPLEGPARKHLPPFAVVIGGDTTIPFGAWAKVVNVEPPSQGTNSANLP